MHGKYSMCMVLCQKKEWPGRGRRGGGMASQLDLTTHYSHHIFSNLVKDRRGEKPYHYFTTTLMSRYIQSLDDAGPPLQNKGYWWWTNYRNPPSSTPPFTLLSLYGNSCYHQAPLLLPMYNLQKKRRAD